MRNFGARFFLLCVPAIVVNCGGVTPLDGEDFDVNTGATSSSKAGSNNSNAGGKTSFTGVGGTGWSASGGTHPGSGGTQVTGGAPAAGGKPTGTGGKYTGTGGKYTGTGGKYTGTGGTSRTSGGTSFGGKGGGAGAGGYSAAGGPVVTAGTWSTAGGSKPNITTAIGGITSAGGSFAGGATQSGGASYGVGGSSSTASGGATWNMGGTSATSTEPNTGCTGSYEVIQVASKLCVAVAAEIEAPELDAVASNNYFIDRTEVTVGQYTAWLETDPALPDPSDPMCGYKSAGTYAIKGNVSLEPEQSHLPVTHVDWCDAREYCEAVGKRLCGKIGGGAFALNEADDPDKGQWVRVCTSGGVNVNPGWPYGDIHEDYLCNGAEFWSSTADATIFSVADMRGCHSSVNGYSDIYDLSGNVGEWTDDCVVGSSTLCAMRGGSFRDQGNQTGCQSPLFRGPTYQADDLGFRCCSL